MFFGYLGADVFFTHREDGQHTIDTQYFDWSYIYDPVLDEDVIVYDEEPYITLTTTFTVATSGEDTPPSE
jgi:hypothetical protein